MILHDIFRVVSRFPRYISCYIAESQLLLGHGIAYMLFDVFPRFSELIFLFLPVSVFFSNSVRITFN